MAQLQPRPRWEPDAGNRTQLAALAINECPWCDYGLGRVLLVRNILILLADPGGLVANGLVLWFLGLHLKRNPFTVYLLNLALADFAFLLCQLLFVLLSLGHREDQFLFHTDLYMDRGTVSPYITALGTVTALSAERCLSVLFPSWHRCRRPPHLSATVCGLLWTLAVLWHLFGDHYCYDWARGFLEQPCYEFSIAWAALLFPLAAVMLLSGLALLFKVQCVVRPRRPARLYVVTLLLVPVFLVCGLPLGVKWFLSGLLSGSLGWLDHYFHIFYYVADILSCANCCAHPLVYYLVGRRWKRRPREPVGVVFKRVLGDDGELGGEEGDTPAPATVEMAASGAPTGSPKMNALLNSTAPVRPLP
ncbi:mas-related G-protein coupled receptor member A-like [Tachyglossus aculeatus]|uniref:mas-related G-protein coupled receptor member A-like n=1 Tax=Tachyglossus aculeatus TaxID=9261 RepID=UPI0018F57CA1|nr:mas-related G-protein coupled receptor member A-like [Tachyglossus aculeatus]